MTELIDVLDQNGVKTGKIATRDEVHQKGLWHRIAVIAIIDKDNHILLQQRAKSKLTNPNKWDIAAAGHVDTGENAIITVKRETAEEIGIHIDNDSSISDFYFVTSYRKTKNGQWQGKELIDHEFYDCFILRNAKVDVSALRLQASEVQGAKLCSVGEFEQMIKEGVMVDRQPFYNEIIKIMKGQA